MNKINNYKLILIFYILTLFIEFFSEKYLNTKQLLFFSLSKGVIETPEIIIQFLTQFGFDLYFNQLSQSLATILGEEGINLSGGQKQIIALARVLYKKPQLLILDEATSSMDRNTENFTMNLFEKIKPNCAIFFISHRLNSLKKIADIIYILENKTVSNAGSHEELMTTTNFYSSYWQE
jgi:ATP-binding cassette subfamily B protein